MPLIDVIDVHVQVLRRWRNAGQIASGIVHLLPVVDYGSRVGRGATACQGQKRTKGKGCSDSEVQNGELGPFLELGKPLQKRG